MGKSNSAPTYSPPKPPTLQTADQLYGSGINYAKQNQPNAYGARESALTDLQNPSQYYGSFQPTSFENALTSQYFKNVQPDMDAAINNRMSLSGLGTSPAAAAALGKAHGDLGFQVGSYLSDLGNQRANSSLNARLGINPNDIIQPFVNTNTSQSNTQNQMDYGYQQQVAQQQYQEAMNKFNQQQALYKTIGMISPLGGALYGGIAGGGQGLGSSLSGSFSTAQMALPYLMGGAGGGMAGGAGSLASNWLTSGMGNMGGGQAGQATPVNPNMAYNSAMAYNPGMGAGLGSGQYNPYNPYADISMGGGQYGGL